MSTPEPSNPNVVTLGGPPERPNVYEIVPQRHTRIWRKLPEVLGSLSEAEDTSFSAVRASVAQNAYRVLKVFIPDLMDEHAFEGYRTAEGYEAMRAHHRHVQKLRQAHEAEVLKLAEEHQAAIEAGEPLADVEVPEFIEPDFDDPYTEEHDFAPTQPEIRHAIQVALRVNDLDLLKYVKDVVGPDFLKTLLRRQLIGGIDGLIEMSSSTPGTSPLLPSLTGEPTSMNGSAKNPTPADDGSESETPTSESPMGPASEDSPSPESSSSPLPTVGD